MVLVVVTRMFVVMPTKLNELIDMITSLCLSIQRSYERNIRCATTIEFEVYMIHKTQFIKCIGKYIMCKQVANPICMPKQYSNVIVVQIFHSINKFIERNTTTMIWSHQQFMLSSGNFSRFTICCNLDPIHLVPETLELKLVMICNGICDNKNAIYQIMITERVDIDVCVKINGMDFVLHILINFSILKLFLNEFR